MVNHKTLNGALKMVGNCVILAVIIIAYVCRSTILSAGQTNCDTTALIIF